MPFETPFKKPAFIVDEKPLAQEHYAYFLKNHTPSSLENADVVIVLGGDGFMLRALHTLLNQQIELPVYGINCGTVGFLMNTFQFDPLQDLFKKLHLSQPICLRPLIMRAVNEKGEEEIAYAINEVSLLRQTSQSAKIRLFVDDILRLETLVGDGILLSTPAGSTAYNFSAGGPILPLEANLLALTPINIFRPRRWHGALLPKTALVRFDVLDPLKRPVKCTADFHEIASPVSVSIQEDPSKTLTLLFDPDHTLERRIIEEQFMA
ncbi:MAG: NAD kinase [Alphaproteobacteria bacterium 16-39-46]|nr:MAG: NAD kinase [Alphaproteobacteria bacterium 16-39-46]OZA44405.1 MAG: NAD kinase [Alphaproteobacteria bacterium 17-39-52]HQS83290.1 NAD kinase [Alphaproteobacteria bacterium]HQS93168.1 NAD kinase [Alphaproteobacteria bacterium]